LGVVLVKPGLGGGIALAGVAVGDDSTAGEAGVAVVTGAVVPLILLGVLDSKG
jgi:hypothetical protein